MPTIHDLVFDEENEEKLWKRRIDPEDVFDVVAKPHLVVRNRRRRRGLYKLIGRGKDGRMLTIILEATSKRTVWRPVTGWPSTAGEITQFEA
jgi:uncharacterized DUF497 family protein